MADQPYDGGSKWLLEHQGRGITLLGGLRDVISTRAIQAEVVQPRQLPDGLLEVKQKGRREPRLLLVEFCTYPESRNPEQLMDDIMLVWQARKVIPEVLALVLSPRGKAQVPQSHEIQSELGWTKARFEWKVQEVWKLPAEEMLAVPDVGIVPWVPLMHHDGPPEPLLRRCRERIDREGGDKRPNLLAVTQILMRLKPTYQGLLELFGRSEAMIESPLAKEIYEKGQRTNARENIERVIKVRHGKLSDEARARLQGVNDDERLGRLLDFAAVCRSLEAFVERLTKETTPSPTPVSSRRKRKS